MNTSMHYALAQDHFEMLSLMANDYLSQHDDCVPCILLDRNSDGFRAFKLMCLRSGSNAPIRWEIPPPSCTQDMDKWLRTCRTFFGDNKAWSIMEPCNSTRVWDAIAAAQRPMDLYALLRDHLVVILIR